MTKKQAGLLIALLAVLILAVSSLAVVLLWGKSGEEVADENVSVPTPTSPAESETPTTEETEDAAEVLASAQVNSIHPAPAPEAPEEWGDYRIHDSWDGQVRTFGDAGPQEITAREGDRFPATMNGCDLGMYFVTFKSVNPNVNVRAHLIDAAGNSAVSEDINQGWSLSTNCETPAMEFLDSGDTSTLGDVVYTVHEYRQSSVAPAQPTEQVEPEVPEEPAEVSTAVAEPTLVQCLGYLSPTGLYSDGSERRTVDCADSPEQRRAARAEGVCGGLYGWMEVSTEEYLDLCGVMPPTHLVPEPTDAYPTEQYPTEDYEPYPSE